jgi:hypothetical protein
MMDHITVKGQGGTFDAYIARPKAPILTNTWERSMGFMRPFSCIWPRRMSSFPKQHKRRLKQHLLRSQMRRCTATRGRVTHSPAITESTTTPPRLTLPMVGRANS